MKIKEIKFKKIIKYLFIQLCSPSKNNNNKNTVK